MKPAMKTVVFLGPSLSLSEAAAVLPDATFLPPAQAGDLFKAVQQDAQVIGLIDGFFEQVPSVWHKEVLYALSRGVHVYGASSMGALRAAETEVFGMVGVGRIFEAYRDGRCEDDDEVTVGHASELEGFKALSEAMVNVRHGLAEALARGLIGHTTHDVVAREIKRRHYAERSWALVPEIAAAHDLPAAEIEALLAYVKAESPNLKRQDCLELLTELRRLSATPPPPFQPRFDFEPTVFWSQLAGTVRTAPSSGCADVPLTAIRAHLAVVEDHCRSVFEGSLLLYLASKEARKLGLEPTGAQVKRVAERFRRSHGLLSARATHEWLARNHCSTDEFSALMEVLALLEAVLDHHSNGVDAFLPPELQRRGVFARVSGAIREKSLVLADLGVAFPSPEDADTTADDLMTWYGRHFRDTGADLEDHLKSRGMGDGNRFLREVLAEYLVERRRAGRGLADGRGATGELRA